ncbi:MAG: nuclear transport factor 2 family protein [Sandaracinaceae bacterium]|nr:nuclear transport factor 2 family protein [Sandaracinaceae bacterium]
MSAETAAEAVHAPAEVAGRFVAALAARDEASLRELLAADATWVRPGKPDCVGTDAVFTAFRVTADKVQQDGPLRVTRGSEVAWPSREGGAENDPGRARVDIIDVNGDGRVQTWTTVSDDRSEAAQASGAPARRQALAQYVERVGRADAEATLLLYSGECDVEDPVGTPVHRGRAAVETFYRGGLSAITGTSPLSAAVVSGNVGAIAFRVELALPDRAIAIEVIDVMTFDDDHLFTSMRAFWGRVNRLAR